MHRAESDETHGDDTMNTKQLRIRWDLVPRLDATLRKKSPPRSYSKRSKKITSEAADP